MKKSVYAALCSFCLCLLLAGCVGDGGPALDEVETVTLDGAGFSLTLPAEWQSRGPQSEHGAYAFSGAQEELRLEIVAELGGMEYYSLVELGDMLAQDLTAAAFSAEPAVEQWDNDYYYSSTLRGVNAQGEDLVCRVDIVAPYSSVRYYLLYTAEAEAYEANRQVIDDVLRGFTITKTAEETYQMIAEQRAAEAEAAAEAEEESSNDGEE